MSYISRMEREKENSVKNKRSDKLFKRTVALGVILSVISIILVVVFVSTSGNDDSNTTTVVAPKLASQGGPTSGFAPSDASGTDPLIANLLAYAEKSTGSEGGKTPTTNGHNDVLQPDSSPGQKAEVVVHGNEDNKPANKVKTVYLTFDDGPSKFTNQILDILNEKKVHATFFLIGRQLSSHEQEVKDIFDAGNYVGLHSMTHNKKTLYDSGSSANFIKEFTKEQGLVENIIGVKPVLIRAPYGSQPSIGPKFRDDIAAANFKMWDWTVDSKDWNFPHHPDKILSEVKRQLHRNTEVILMHEKEQTVSVLPEIIDYLSKKGYSFAVYKPEQHISVNFAKDKRL